jgi:7SK snRNA methylphosphate capping enzyme
MHERVRVGGLLLLEPQPWKSYKRRRHLSATITRNYKEIKLKPSAFVDKLVEIGFDFIETIWPSPETPGKTGFQRPIHVLRKRGGDPALQ